MKHAALVICVALFSAVNANAQMTDMFTCSTINDAKERLSCFDAAALLEKQRRIFLTNDPEGFLKKLKRPAGEPEPGSSLPGASPPK